MKASKSSQKGRWTLLLIDELHKTCLDDSRLFKAMRLGMRKSQRKIGYEIDSYQVEIYRYERDLGVSYDRRKELTKGINKIFKSYIRKRSDIDTITVLIDVLWRYILMLEPSSPEFPGCWSLFDEWTNMVKKMRSE